MEISVIIPAFNREKTIGAVLDSIFESTLQPYEVFVIDDKSDDWTAEIAKKYPVEVISLPKNHGPAVARNIGAQRATGDLLVFIDSDVLIKPDSLQRIHDSIHCVFGNPEFDNGSKSIFGRHFNWRTCFNFSRLPPYNDIVWGSIFGIKSSAFDEVGGFSRDKNFIGVEDNELGYRLRKRRVIFHDKDLLVTHLKEMTFWELLKNDFKRAFARVNLMFKHRKITDIITSGRFISTPIDQLLSPFCAVLALLNPWFFLAFLASQSRYLWFISRRGQWFDAILLIPILFIDMLVVFLGICCGVLSQ